MTSRPSVSESLPTPTVEAEAIHMAPTSPSEAVDRPVVGRPGTDPDYRPVQSWRQVSDEEWRARHEEYKKRLAEIDAEDDTPEEVYDQVMRNIDEERRRQGRPPAFAGDY
jgi:hypothetical protein